MQITTTKLTTKKFGETHEKDSFKRYSNEDVDVIVYEHIHGKSTVFRKLKKDKYFHECTGGLGYSCGKKSKINGENVISEDVSLISGYEHFNEFKLFIDGDKCLYNNNSTNFHFLDKNKQEDIHGFGLKTTIKDLEYMCLPNNHVIEYLYQISDEKYILVTSPEYNSTYESSKFYFIKNNRLIESKILDFTRYRDGGTTVIKVKEGEFFKPTSFEKEKKPTWNDNFMIKIDEEELQKVDNLRFIIPICVKNLKWLPPTLKVTVGRGF